MSATLDSDASEVTVVVATRNRWADLQRSLLHHAGPTIVVDNGSTDGTPDHVQKRFPDVEVVALGENLGAQARNVGVARASTPYVAFADDDSWWAPGALERAARVLTAHPRLALLAARVLVGEECRPDWMCAVMAESPLPREPDLPGPSVLGFLGCAAVVRREAFLAVGGFDDVVFFCGEEQRVALDLAAVGWGLAYVEDVVAHHHPSPVRDAYGREVLAARNALLTDVMRRPWRVVADHVVRLASSGVTGRAGLRAAMPRVPRAVRSRQPLPADVEAVRLLLDAAPHRAAESDTTPAAAL